MKIKNIDTLIAKFLSDTISREELASLSEWASESRENRAALSSRMKEWAKDNGSFDADKAFGRFKTRVVMEKRPARSNRRVWLWTAAAAAALAVFGLVSYQAYQVRTYRNLLANEEVTVKAPVGSKSYAELPDGSKVWLNAGSSLTYSYDVSKKERTVDLSGEGFFEVYHDEKTPFTVSSSSLNVRVLGTKFNVIADEKVLDDAGKIDAGKLNAFAFDQMQNGYYAIGEKVGQAWQTGKALMTRDAE